ncbi:LOW QUALITY PROTEIN: Cyclic AMP-dependent protein kinase [Phytophthora megakarya]|uniref:Cyclic AMP-dependent protein kinase n=1 Tax=Phytophthora megakarya TaxID=4795 RepID=A0A225VXT7_9STRA|nr:LOW QUALITY PROTEIN: Cyclic AMP-dependent protein kinase [Phytophthora megakarya]
MRELVMEGLVSVLQAQQTTAMMYRSSPFGLVERFHRTWKDLLSTFVAEVQNDLDWCVNCAVFAYYGAQHSGTGYNPNELMMCASCVPPSEFLRESEVSHVGRIPPLEQMVLASAVAKAALTRDQIHKSRYDNRRVRHTTTYAVRDLFWVLRQPRGRGITKPAYKWLGLVIIEEDAGFDN